MKMDLMEFAATNKQKLNIFEITPLLTGNISFALPPFPSASEQPWECLDLFFAPKKTSLQKQECFAWIMLALCEPIIKHQIR